MKEGDIYYISWGYDQTNVDFYRVIKLRGKTQAVVQAVDLELNKVDCISSMSGDYSYNPKHYTVKDNDVFIKDNTKGRIVKRGRSWTDDKDIFSLDGHLAMPYKGQKVYESFYA